MLYTSEKLPLDEWFIESVINGMIATGRFKRLPEEDTDNDIVFEVVNYHSNKAIMTKLYLAHSSIIEFDSVDEFIKHIIAECDSGFSRWIKASGYIEKVKDNSDEGFPDEVLLDASSLP